MIDPGIIKKNESILKIHAKALGIPSGAAEDFIQKSLKAATKKLSTKTIITEKDLQRALAKELKKYNQDLCENSCLIEVGSQANLLSEAKYSARLLSKVLIKYLTGKI